MASRKASLNGHGFDIRSLGEKLQVTAEEKRDLDHALAKELLDMPTITGERRFRTRHAANLVSHMHRGTFHWNLVTLIVCRCKEQHGEHPAGTTFRMNGQHTCWARLQMPENYRAPIRFVRYTAATEHDMRMLYATIDRAAARTKGNVILSYILGDDEYASYNAHVLKYVTPGVPLWLWETREQKSNHDGDDVAYVMLKEKSAVVHAVCRFLNNFPAADYRHIMRAPVAAAMLATFSKDREAAAEFWTAVATSVGFTSATDARRVLNKYLMETSIKASSSGRPKLDTTEGMYRVCISAWNAWRSQKPVRLVRAAPKRPVVV